MSLLIRQLLDMVDDRKRVYHFTPASADEELDLQDTPWYTTIYCDTTSYAGKVTLPPVAEFDGVRYDVYIKTGGTNAITVQDRDDSAGWTDLTIEDANDHVAVESNRITWDVLVNVEAD